MAHAIEYHRLRAPREHGQTFFDPPLARAATTIAANQQLLQQHGNMKIAGQPLQNLRQQARRELFVAAQAYSAHTLGQERFQRLGLQAGAALPETFILSGHQPELFHPGVWFKNFVLSSLGRSQQAAAINLIIDNDTVAAPAIRVPDTRGEKATQHWCAYDDPAADLPYEERALRNRATFAAFPNCTDPAGRLLTSRLWQLASTADDQRLGAIVAAARHRLEVDEGLQTLELPLSVVCDSEVFMRFSLHLLQNLPALFAIYNGAIQEYRVANKVRSRSHPVPELARAGDALEAPFWIWSSDLPARRPLFVSSTDNELVLTDQGHHRYVVPVAAARSTERTYDAWRALRASGVKIRPRALITTMYARLLLGDLFLHGIGGAKYDQLTDALIERFFHVTPPQFMTVTATIKRFAVDESTPDVLRAVTHRLRELPFHPETAVEPVSDEHRHLIEEKGRLLAAMPPKGQRKPWHAAIVTINAKLLAFASSEHQRLLALQQQLLDELPRTALLSSREFSFCLFSESLVHQLKRLADHET